jgi:hypothetical protein
MRISFLPSNEDIYNALDMCIKKQKDQLLIHDKAFLDIENSLKNGDIDRAKRIVSHYTNKLKEC